MRKGRKGKKGIVKAINNEKKAIVRAIKVSDPTIERLNFNRKDRIVTFKKSITLNSFAYNNVVGFGVNFLYDPSNTVTGSLFSAIADWANLTGLFNEYRIKNIKTMFTYQSSATTPEKEPFVLIRNNAVDYTSVAPTLANMTQYANVIKKTFTPEHPCWSYNLKPAIAVPVFQGTGVLGTTSYRMQKAPWCDVNDPVLHYGLGIYFSTISPTQSIIVDVEYTIDFKEAR